MRIAEHVLVIVQSAEFGGWQICWTLYGSCFDIGATPTIHQLQITSDFILTWKWIWLQPRLLCMNIIALLLVTRMILRKAVALLSPQWGLVFFLSFFWVISVWSKYSPQDNNVQTNICCETVHATHDNNNVSLVYWRFSLLMVGVCRQSGTSCMLTGCWNVERPRMILVGGTVQNGIVQLQFFFFKKRWSSSTFYTFLLPTGYGQSVWTVKQMSLWPCLLLHPNLCANPRAARIELEFWYTKIEPGRR